MSGHRSSRKEATKGWESRGEETEGYGASFPGHHGEETRGVRKKETYRAVSYRQKKNSRQIGTNRRQKEGGDTGGRGKNVPNARRIRVKNKGIKASEHLQDEFWTPFTKRRNAIRLS